MSFALRSQSAAQSRRVNRGRRLEDDVERLHELATFRAHAHLWRAHPGVRGGRTVAPQGPDFAGFLVSGARHVFVEVKGILEGDLALPRPGLTPSGNARLGAFTSAELERLRLCDAAGGLAVVLVLHGPQHAAAWCPFPWQLIEQAMDTGAPCIRAAKILGRRCAPETYLRRAEFAARNLWRHE